MDDKKRRKLNYDKCAFCRRDKKRCDPRDRRWPQKCDRCESKRFCCSKSTNVKTIKPTPSSEDEVAVGNEGDRPSEDSQRLECQDWELELDWLRRCEDYTARIKFVNKSESFDAVYGIHGLESDIRRRRDEILREVSDLLHCPSPLVKNAALSVASSVTSRRSPTGDGEYDTVGSEEVLRALLKSVEASDRIDIELSIRERLIRAMDDQTDPDQVVDAISDYVRACERYMKCIRQVGYHDFLCPGEHGFPFNGDTRILNLLIRCSSKISFQAKDVFGLDLLASAMLIAEQTDIEQLVQKMDKAKILDLARGNGEYNHTILHSAAVRGIMSVFNKVKELDPGDIRSIIDSQDKVQRTPLMLAAGQGDRNVMETLLKLGANLDISDEAAQNVLHHAVRNRHEEVVRELAYRDPHNE